MTLSPAASSSSTDLEEIDPFKGTLPIDVNDLKNTSLAAMTQYLGFSMSTYQNRCRGLPPSNWSVWEEKHLDEELRSGGGIDPLISEHRTMIIDAVKKCGGNTLRISVEWAEVMPNKGEINELALERYHEACKEFVDAGLTVFITLHHFVDPAWFTEEGGFENKRRIDSSGFPAWLTDEESLETKSNIEYFVTFAEAVYETLGGLVEHFVTFNEPGVYAAQGYYLGDFPPNRTMEGSTVDEVQKNMLKAHCQVYNAIHSLAERKKQNVQVGLTHQALKFKYTTKWNFVAWGTAKKMTSLFHKTFMEKAEQHRDKLDFMGVQFYSRPLIGGLFPDSTCEKDEKMVDCMRFRFDPEGIEEVLLDVGRRFPDTPLIVTETGTAGNNDAPDMDSRRAEYYFRSMKAVRKVQDAGANVIGFLAWTLFDNFEWNHGYSRDHAFGVIARSKGSDEMRETGGYDVLQQVFTQTLQQQQAESDAA